MSANVVFWKFLETEELDPETPKNTRVPMARDYWVFNADKVDGFKQPEDQPANTVERIDQTEAFFKPLEVNIQHGGDKAFYRPSNDTIHMPAF
ncbi:MAG: hypothetical protein FJW30_18210 [Acidobacteria bacterium]|nr:hypothetical protein [Acidobacteriota bacterium]